MAIKIKQAIARLPRMAMIASLLASLIGTSIAQAQVVEQARWMKGKKWGISHHYLAGGGPTGYWYNIQGYDKWNNYVNEFDVDEYAELAEKLGIGYLIFTTGQNRGYLATTSTVYDNNSPPCPRTGGTVNPAPVDGWAGCKNQNPGTGGRNRKADYTPSRDLMLDLASAVGKKDIKFIAYLSSHLPYLWTGKRLPREWPEWYIADFVTEKSKAWGDKIDGWWFDGAVSDKGVKFVDSPYAKKFYDSAVSGNANTAITFNTGSSSAPSFESVYEHYTSGEFVPATYNGEDAEDIYARMTLN